MPGTGNSVGHARHAEASCGGAAGRESRVYAGRPQDSGTCDTARNAVGGGAASPRAWASEDGVDPGRLRAEVRRRDENNGSPVPWTLDDRRVAQAPLGPWTASRAADSGADWDRAMSNAVESRAPSPDGTGGAPVAPLHQ